MHLRSFLLFLSSLLFALSSVGQQRISAPAKQAVDSLYIRYAKEMKKGGISIALVDTDGIIYSQGYGFANQEELLPVTDSTIFGIGSISKSFTVLSILQLQNSGKLKTSESIKTYLPDLKIKNYDGSENKLLINDIMAHTSGLQGEVLNGFFCDLPPAQSSIIPELNKQMCAAPSGYQFAYSNIGYGLLGETIQRLSGESYARYLDAHILGPLGMTSTFVDREDPRNAKAALTYIGGKMYRDANIRDEAAGMIRSTAVDMAKYVKALLRASVGKNEGVISYEMITSMSANQQPDIQLKSVGPQFWGWGLYTYQLRNKKDSSEARLVGHAGDTFGYHSNIAFIPELGLGVVILTNNPAAASSRNTLGLINTYLKAEGRQKYQMEYPKVPVRNSPMSADMDTAIRGTYFINDALFKFDQKQRLVGKQGPAKVVFSRIHPDSSLYTVKAKLFGFIGIKVKDQCFRFEEKNGSVYFKGIALKNYMEDYVAKKETAGAALPDTWRNALGAYSISGDFFKCNGCPALNFEKLLSVKLTEQDGFLRFEMIFSEPKEVSAMYLKPLHASAALSVGVGRGTGNTLLLEPDGALYFSGLRFSKVK